MAPVILWSLVAYKLLGPSAQPLLGAAEPGSNPTCCPSLGVGSLGAQPAAAAVAASSGGTMGASLSQDTAYLPEEVVNNYRRSDDRDLRFRLALASHQRFYKHFDPAKLVLTEDEFRRGL